MKVTLSGLTIKEVYCGNFAFVEDKEMNLGDEPHDPEEVESYVVPERLNAILEPHCNATGDARIEIELPDDELRCFLTELEYRIDIFDDNHNFNRTDGRGKGHSAGRGADAAAAAEFKAGLRMLKADYRMLVKRLEECEAVQ